MVAVVDDEDDESSKKESIDVSLGRVILAGRLVVDHPQWAAALPIVTLSQQCIPIAIIGCAGGLVAWLYFVILEASLHFVWKTMPDYLWKNANAIDENDGGITNSGFFLLHPMVWIPVTTFTFATIMALATIALGEPIDLATTVFCVHHHGWLSMQHVIPIAVTSLCTILAGASLGPEAPLVSICAALAGYLSKTVMGHTDRHMIRKHTVMGMACATAAFFGCPLGGSLFAIEVVSARFGGEINCFQQFTVSAILSGTVSLGVFRWMAQLPIEPIWDFTLDSGNDVFISKISSTLPIHMLYGAILGSLGALVACLYALLRGTICQCFQNHSLLKRHPGHADQRSNPLNNQSIVLRAWMGATAIILLGMTFPHTLFWGEFEFQTIATMCPATKLPHLKFAQSIVGWEMHNAPTAGLLGVAKFIAIAVAIAGGYRGGFIFPLFAAAAALGRALHFVLPIIPVQLCVLCLAAAVNVAVTRTALATTLILTYLSGEPNALSAILVASLVSLNITSLAPWVFTTASTPPPPTELVSSSDEEHVTINLCSLNKCSLTKRDFDTCNDSTTLLHDGGRFNENDDDKSGQKDELTVFLPDDDHKVIKKSTVPT